MNIYFSEPVEEKWYKYDIVNGWREYSKDYPGMGMIVMAYKRVEINRFINQYKYDSRGKQRQII